MGQSRSPGAGRDRDAAADRVRRLRTGLVAVAGMSVVGVPPLTDEQLRNRHRAAIGALPDDARRALGWLRRGLATSPLLPLAVRRMLLRAGGVKLGMMVWGLERCWFQSPQGHHRDRLLCQRRLLVRGRGRDRGRRELPVRSRGARPYLYAPTRIRRRDRPRHRVASDRDWRRLLDRGACHHSSRGDDRRRGGHRGGRCGNRGLRTGRRLRRGPRAEASMTRSRTELTAYAGLSGSVLAVALVLMRRHLGWRWSARCCWPAYRREPLSCAGSTAARTPLRPV